MVTGVGPTLSQIAKNGLRVTALFPINSILSADLGMKLKLAIGAC